MSTEWVLLQIWVTGCVGGLMWLLVAWINETWARLTQQRRNRLEKRRPTRPKRCPATESPPADDKYMVRTHLMRTAASRAETAGHAIDIRVAGKKS